MTLRAASRTALGGHLLLLVTVVAWHAWFSPPQALPRVLPIIALGAPLVLVLRGLLRNNPGSHHASCLIALVYFALGVTNIAGGDGAYGWLQTLASTAWFAGSALSLKHLNR